MNIRKAVAEDESHIFELLKQFPAGRNGYDWQKGVATFHDMIANPGLGSVFVADVERVILGVITLSYPISIRSAGIYACIEEFIVDAKGRGKGIGGKLIETAIKEAQSKGCYELQVNRPSESGYPVYIRHGWKELGKHLNLRLKE